jgi:transcriptional regulator with XRE-family HTH domain
MQKRDLAELVSTRLEELKGCVSQRDVASRAGYKNQNMITMIKQGTSKVSIDRAHDLAAALDINQKEFAILVLEQFYSKNVLDRLFKDLGVQRD